ncbi:MAG: hypothetical protein HeimC3_35920 [Candidatus Heimdallarchaeota archaeon LC_3]|nr:MAG: hypothetical protein HeimC3_35920 [Candidatus Heimdallarchaeota archaeon LC_3]
MGLQYDQVTDSPIWVQNDLQSMLIGKETVQHCVVIANYPLGLKKAYLAVTDKRLVGKIKKWFSTNQVDVPLRDISRVQLDTAFKIKSLFWLIISLFFSIYLIGIPFVIYNYFRMREKAIIISVTGVGNESYYGNHHKLELIQRTIRESQFQKDE